MTAPRLLFDKIWDAHRVAALGGGYDLLYCDRLLTHELVSDVAFTMLKKAGRIPRRPDLVFATQDHVVSTAPDRDDETNPASSGYIRALRRNAREYGIRLFDLADPQQGIVHVIAPELAIAQPGLVMVCGDSHTCTLGGVGALAWGIGTSEVSHVLATQTLVQRRPAVMRVRCDGRLPPGVGAKDLILALIARYGANAGDGHALEFCGDAITALDVEARLTLCNLAIEMGARMGQVAPDDVTYDYLYGRDYAPRGADWDRAMRDWRTLPSDAGAIAARELAFDASALEPQVTWGTSPEHGTGVSGVVPDPRAVARNAEALAGMEKALAYMALVPGTPLTAIPIDAVFIGSCANSRLGDLRAAAAVVRGRKVAPGVRALVVPGSTTVRRAAEAERLDQVFLAAGFEWREAGCSMCVAMNGDALAPGQRCVSTSNRNFEGRQGPGARTHLAGPATAAASAIAGRIADPRALT